MYRRGTDRKAEGPSKQEQQELDDAARRRFGNAKSISSSQYNNEDESASAYERDSRLQRFQVGSSPLADCVESAKIAED